MEKAVPFEKYLKVEVKKSMTAAAVIARKHLKKTKPFKYAKKDQVSSPGQVPRAHSKYLNNAIYVSVQGNRWFIGLNKLRNEDIPLNLEKGGVPIPENKDLLDEKILKPRPYLDYLYGKSDILKYFQENLDRSQKPKGTPKPKEKQNVKKKKKLYIQNKYGQIEEFSLRGKKRRLTRKTERRIRKWAKKTGRTILSQDDYDIRIQTTKEKGREDVLKVREKVKEEIEKAKKKGKDDVLLVRKKGQKEIEKAMEKASSDLQTVMVRKKDIKRKVTRLNLKRESSKKLRTAGKLLKKTNKKVTKFAKKNIKLFKKKIKKITKKNARRR